MYHQFEVDDFGGSRKPFFSLSIGNLGEACVFQEELREEEDVGREPHADLVLVPLADGNKKSPKGFLVQTPPEEVFWMFLLGV